MPRYLITGATGFVGRTLVRRLQHARLQQGDSSEPASSITCLTRDVVGARQTLGERGLLSDVALLSWADWEQGRGTLAAATDVVINLAGSRAVGVRWTPRVKARILSSRVEATGALIDGFQRRSTAPAVLLNVSGVDYYGSVPTERECDEGSPPGAGFLAQVCQDWERAALRARDLGTKVSLLRLGIVLGRSGGVLESMLPAFRCGLGGPLGSGTQGVSWIHEDDVANVMLFIAERGGMEGPVNLTSPQPVSNREFSQTLADVLGRPAWLRTPAWVLRGLFGEGASPLLEGRFAPPRALLTAGFEFSHPNLRSAIHKALISKS